MSLFNRPFSFWSSTFCCASINRFCSVARGKHPTVSLPVMVKYCPQQTIGRQIANVSRNFFIIVFYLNVNWFTLAYNANQRVGPVLVVFHHFGCLLRCMLPGLYGAVLLGYNGRRRIVHRVFPA